MVLFGCLIWFGDVFFGALHISLRGISHLRNERSRRYSNLRCLNCSLDVRNTFCPACTTVSHTLWQVGGYLHFFFKSKSHFTHCPLRTYAKVWNQRLLSPNQWSSVSASVGLCKGSRQNKKIWRWIRTPMKTRYFQILSSIPTASDSYPAAIMIMLDTIHPRSHRLLSCLTSNTAIPS